MFIVFDTETTGLPRNFKAPISDSENWPRMVQLAYQLHDATGKLIRAKNFIVKPEGYTIPFKSVEIHGITTERALEVGLPLEEVLEEFQADLAQAKYGVGHNIAFDYNIVGAEMYRVNPETEGLLLDQLDTASLSTEYCALPGGRGGKFKFPKLIELHEKLFGHPFDEAHDAAYDVDATAKCFFELIKRRVIPLNEVKDPEGIRYEAPELEEANFAHQSTASVELPPVQAQATPSVLEGKSFVHLHCHSQFSILQSTSAVDALVSKAKEMGMPAIGITDHGNMMGAYNFVAACEKQDMKAIVGLEINVCQDRLNKDVKDDGFQTVLLAKNKNGYHNLAKLASIAYTEGFYYVPRIDKTVLAQYKEDIIVTTGGLWGEVPNLILQVGETQAEESFAWYKETFGENFYAELNRHGLTEEQVVNEVLLNFCEKYGVKYIAANNTYYTEKTEAKSHDILLCVKDAEPISKPKKYMGARGREYRFGFPNEEFYLKSPEEMHQLFADLPEAITNTLEIYEQIEPFKLKRDVLLPKFEIPDEFVHPEDDEDGGKRGENAYLRHLTYEGAKKRYGEITDEIRERLDFELQTIENTGYPGYFLIVQDFTTAARNMGVSVGPGRGSAAGSAVAYCIGITNVDPIKYDLLFERFLNPDRVSLPDIDIDFDDEGRQKVIDYVIDKYGSNQVAQIITYGTMAAKSSIRDTARVMELPLSDADRIAKLVPDVKLKKLFGWSEAEMKTKLNADQMQMAEQLLDISKHENLEGQTLNQARILEGSVRNTGIHACGVIITPDDITKFVPVATAKDSDMVCTQFDNAVVESAGLLKMDFLGLKTLTLIKDACAIVKERHGVDLDPDAFPLDDEKTYELFQRGETVGIFQYESPGMQKHMKALKPTTFGDLIAMNALYRPGPLEYIPDFIDRKHGRQEITYDLEGMEEYLQETYGITVYQEQVMLLSQKLAGFTKGEADVLRKAMGKKIFSLLEELKPKFINQGAERGHDKTALEKVWKDWEAFAAYAFNKSHSTCYAWVAFQTAYLKAHYPAEYMASVLSNNMNDISSVTFFMEECKRMGVPVLGPDVSESAYKFTVNAKGEIRFGLGAVKGVGKGAVEAIVAERQNGPYQTIFDFTSRVDLKSVNRRTMESLALAGAFDNFPNMHRALFFHQETEGQTFLEKAIKFGAGVQQAKDAPPDLFGDSQEVTIQEPPIPLAKEWDRLYQLKREKEMVGIYISGHPLDDFKFEIKHFCSHSIDQLMDVEKLPQREISFAGIVSAVQERNDKRGNPFGIFTIEDFTDAKEFLVFRDDWARIRNYMIKDSFVYIKAKVDLVPWRGSKEIKFQQVQFLEQAMENNSKQLELHFELREVNEALSERLIQLCQEFPGQQNLELTVHDRETKIQLNLPSRSLKVQVCNPLIERLEEWDIKYRLN